MQEMWLKVRGWVSNLPHKRLSIPDQSSFIFSMQKCLTMGKWAPRFLVCMYRLRFNFSYNVSTAFLSDSRLHIFVFPARTLFGSLVEEVGVCGWSPTLD